MTDNEEVSALKALATLLRENIDVIEYCQDRSADYLLPCSGLIEAISKLAATVVEQTNASTREVTKQFDADGAA